MSKLITANDLEWRTDRLHDLVHVGDYHIIRLPYETYIIYQLSWDYQPITRVGIFYNLDEVLSVLNHDQKEEV